MPSWRSGFESLPEYHSPLMEMVYVPVSETGFSGFESRGGYQILAGVV